MWSHDRSVFISHATKIHSNRVTSPRRLYNLRQTYRYRAGYQAELHRRNMGWQKGGPERFQMKNGGDLDKGLCSPLSSRKLSICYRVRMDCDLRQWWRRTSQSSESVKPVLLGRPLECGKIRRGASAVSSWKGWQGEGTEVVKMMRRRLRLKSYYELGDYCGHVEEALVIKLQDQFWCWDSHHYTRVRLNGEATLRDYEMYHSVTYYMRASLSRSSKYYRLVLMNVMP